MASMSVKTHNKFKRNLAELSLIENDHKKLGMINNLIEKAVSVKNQGFWSADEVLRAKNNVK